MTRSKTQRNFPRAIVTSTVGTTLISVMAAWLVTSTLFMPVAPTRDAAVIEQNKLHKSSDRPLYRLSPIPPGADWTS